MERVFVEPKRNHESNSPKSSLKRTQSSPTYERKSKHRAHHLGVERQLVGPEDVVPVEYDPGSAPPARDWSKRARDAWRPLGKGDGWTS